MGLFSGLCSFVSDVVSFVSDTVSSLANPVGELLKIAFPYLDLAIKAIQVVGVLLDVLREDDNIDELGGKAIIADKKPEDFISNAEYIHYLKNEIELDHKKFDEASDLEKYSRTFIGATIVAKGIEEKKDFDIPLETWGVMAKLDLADKAKEINMILDTFKDEKLDDFIKYTEGKLEIKEESEISGKLVKMYHQDEPYLSSEELEEKVMKMEVSNK